MSDTHEAYSAGSGSHYELSDDLNDNPLPLYESSISEQVEPTLHGDEEVQSHETEDFAQEETPTVPDSTPDPYRPWIFDENGFGILPQCLTILWAAIATLSVAFFLLNFVYLSAVFSAWKWYAKTLQRAMYFGGDYIFTLLPIMVLWAPIVCAVAFELSKEPARTSIVWLIRVACLCVFGLLVWGYCVLETKSNVSYINSTDIDIGNMGKAPFGVLIQGWETGTMPKSFHSCDARVLPRQAPLFAEVTYQSQFARTYTTVFNSTLKLPSRGYRGHIIPAHNFTSESHIYPAFDAGPFLSVQNNATLCDHGFLGNSDLYGLGIRSGIYLQWISSLLANNFLSTTRQDIQKMYLIFSLAICLATIIASAVKTCIFSVEIEILYWMYWGGYTCVFGSAPCSITLGTMSRWVKVDWTGVILFTTHWIMTYHGIWFIWLAYDQVFSRMPCGTYHFFFAPILDPSVGYWVLRDVLILIIVPSIPLLLTAFPLVAILLVPEVKHAIQGSVVYQTFLHPAEASDQQLGDLVDDEPESSVWSRIYVVAKEAQGRFRSFCSLPTQRRGGIRLVTPIDVKHRRLLRIRWAATGLTACVLSIIAIELTLKWNKVGGVYSIESTGQYVPLIIGIAGLISVCWSVIQQESERRRRLICYQSVGEVSEEYELQSLTSAISHAFTQPDTDFLMSSTLSTFLDSAGEDIANIGISNI